MLWTNNPEMLRALHNERVRQAAEGRRVTKPRLKLVAMEAEADGTVA